MPVLPKPVGASRRIADWRAADGRGELRGRLDLALARRGERGPEPEAAQPLARPEAQVEELGDALEALGKEAFVRGAQGDRLGEAGVGLDEDELALLAGAPQRRSRPPAARNTPGSRPGARAPAPAGRGSRS